MNSNFNPIFSDTQRITITGEENASLQTGSMEFSYGNGASSGSVRNHGVLMDKDWDLESFGLSVAQHGGGTVILEIYVNLLPTGVQITLEPNELNVISSFARGTLTGVAGDIVSFFTVQGSGSVNACVATAYIQVDAKRNIGNGGGGTPPDLNPDMIYAWGNYDTSTQNQTRVNFTIQRTGGTGAFKIQFQNVNWNITSVQNPNGATFSNLGGGIVEVYGNIQNIGETANAVLIATTGEVGTQNPTDDPPIAFSLLP